jgi:PhnB protein
MVVQPYLSFEGRCEEALRFYEKAAGATTDYVMRFGEAPEKMPGTQPPADKILHASFRIGDSVIMASDGYCAGKAQFSGIALAVTAKDLAEGERLMKAMSEGGQVTMPFAKTFFSPGFGMLTDRFGVGWMVVVEQKEASHG